MKTILCCVVAFFAFCLNAADEKSTKESAENKIASTEKAKVLPPMMAANAKEFQQLKEGLGIKDADLTRTDVLELIVLAYAKLIDGLEAKVVNLENRTFTLEQNVKTLRDDTDKLQKQAKSFDDDLNKLFDWMNKTDEELHNDCEVGGVANKIKKLREDVASDLDNHSLSINRNANSINSLRQSVNENSSAISAIIRSLR